MKYTAIRSEGGLLPYDLLDEILSETAPGQKGADFGLPKGRRVSDEIQRVWLDAQELWSRFKVGREKLTDKDPHGTTLTRDRWIGPLLTDPVRLSYDLHYQPSAAVLDGVTFPISHRAGEAIDSPPVHIEGCGIELDKRPQKYRVSPQAMVQEFLNRGESLWGVVTNGLRFRLLRNSVRTARPTYLEFDLETILEGSQYNEFVLFYRLCHRTRLPQVGRPPEDCWLETYHRQSIEKGGRVRDNLRDGVEEALKVLGTGFLRHSENAALREKIDSGKLSADEYHRQLLLLVYRLLFLTVAEDRHLVISIGESAVRNQAVYQDNYSIGKLRERAEGLLEDTDFSDLWVGLTQTFKLFADSNDTNPLGIPPLNGDLFSHTTIPDLEAAQLSNLDLLKAVRWLMFYRERNVRQRVNYAALDVEELGSVYESLLDFRPVVSKEPDGRKFDLGVGSERKTTGSYYTRPELVRELIQSALVPVLEDRLAEAEKQAKGQSAETVRNAKVRAILGISVCDPACGSGHFLLEAARRLGKELARTRVGEDEPTPEQFHVAVRDVISHCIYGVDQNPLAVDLCKLALWLEGHWAGKPLSFLDHRIRCGNSLIGVLDPAIMAGGIPDDAFSPVSGDDKKVAAAYKKRNKAEKALGQKRLEFEQAPTEHSEEYAELFGIGLDFPEDKPADVRKKADLFAKARSGVDWWHDWTAANLWTASFFVALTRLDDPLVPTQDTFLSYLLHHQDRPQMTGFANSLARDLHFFHWHLEFPEVFENGGFHVVIGNPPWDTLSPDAKEFFSTYDPQVRVLAPSQQEKRIRELCQTSAIASAWIAWCRHLYTVVRFLKQSGRYRLYAPGNLGKGDFNVYRMFVETAMSIVQANGRIGQVVPEGFYNGANCMAIREALFDNFEVGLLLGFENARGTWFSGVHRSAKFCLYSACKAGKTEEFVAAFNIRTLDRLSRVKSGECLRMPLSVIKEFSPVALGVMEFENQADIDVCRKIYRHWPRFGDSGSSGQTRTYMREVDMGNDRELFSSDDSGMPVYEGRMVGIFDHRAKGYRSGRGRAADWEEFEFSDPEKRIQPQWHIDPGKLPPEVLQRIKQYRVGFCDVASPTNDRSLVAALIPPDCVCGHKVPTFTFEPDFEWAYMVWLAVANSFTMDFVVRKKISLTMSYTVLDSLPFPRLRADDPVARTLVPLALRLTCTSPEMNDYWNLVARCGFVEIIPPQISPPGFVDQEERQAVLCKLEAIVAKVLFGLSRSEVEFILGTFPIVRKTDEKLFGVYRTQQLVLQEFDKLANSTLPTNEMQ